MLMKADYDLGTSIVCLEKWKEANYDCQLRRQQREMERKL